MQTRPHWSPDADFSSLTFFIRRMDTSGYVKSAEVPMSRLPLIGFIYVSAGEVLVEAEGTPYLCQAGHLLLIPALFPFSIRYYRDAVGYMGGFVPAALPDSAPLRFLTAPHHQAFWFDEGAFVSELFNMLAESFARHDEVFVEKGLDLLLSRIKWGDVQSFPPVVSAFLESVFAEDRTPGGIASYAEEAGISENYLSRLVKKATGRSIGSWIDIVRISRAKRLLAGSDTAVIDVAAAVGLEDQSYFARLFKKETGMTPSAFRKRMQGLNKQ